MTTHRQSTSVDKWSVFRPVISKLIVLCVVFVFDFPLRRLLFRMLATACALCATNTTKVTWPLQPAACVVHDGSWESKQIRPRQDRVETTHPHLPPLSPTIESTRSTPHHPNESRRCVDANAAPAASRSRDCSRVDRAATSPGNIEILFGSGPDWWCTHRDPVLPVAICSSVTV